MPGRLSPALRLLANPRGRAPQIDSSALGRAHAPHLPAYTKSSTDVAGGFPAAGKTAAATMISTSLLRAQLAGVPLMVAHPTNYPAFVFFFSLACRFQLIWSRDWGAFNRLVCDGGWVAAWPALH